MSYRHSQQMSLEELPDGRVERDLAAFVSELVYDDVPDDAVRTVERCYLDTLGVALAGAVAPPGRTARRLLAAAGSAGGDATVLGETAGASAPAAAFVNGTAAHALDFDDMTERIGHPSPPLVPAALAVGELTGATGRDLLTAYVAGFEVASYLASALEPGHYRAGWHSTSTYGTFSAAAAAAWLLDLGPGRTRHALTVAASSPAGLQRNFGTHTKPMHAGQAARAGTTAALLAAEGFTADSTAIGGEGGFLDVYSGPGGVDLDATPDVGAEWAIVEHGVQVKKYPCCYRTHPAIAAAADLTEAADLDPEAVERVRVSGSERGPQILVHDDPDTGFEGKFSLPYTVASAIVRDEVDLDAFEDDRIDDPLVQRVRERVSFEVDPDVPYTGFETTVVVETGDGERYEATRQNPPGRGATPLSDDEVRRKFDRCARRAVDDETARRARERLDALREQDAADVVALARALAR
jgi:2-methylcitrate dehydratase PrpD